MQVHNTKPGLMHSHQPPNINLEFILSHCLCFDTFSALCWNHSSADVILFDHFLCFCALSNKMKLHCLRCLRLLLNVSRVGKGESGSPAISLHQSRQLLFQITRSLFFIATPPSPCHHICVHPPANCTARFLQMTLIGNDVFSAQVDIQSINDG